MIEGVMGLFEARRAERTAGMAPPPISPRISACRSCWCSTSARQAQSAAAIVRGFASHDPAVRIAGVILNRVGSERHRALVADAIAAARRSDPRRAAARRRACFAGASSRTRAGQRTCGPRGPDRSSRRYRRASFRSRRHSRPRRIVQHRRNRHGALALPPPGQRIALARDQAFSFVYPHVIDAWRQRRRRDPALLAARRRTAAARCR